MSGNLYIFASLDMKRALSSIVFRAAAAIVTAFALFSCAQPFEYGDGFGFIVPPEGASQDKGVRNPTELTRNVLLLYSAGHTSGIPKYLKEDIQDLMKGWLPRGTGFSNDVVLVYSHLPKTTADMAWNYSERNSPVLFRLYMGEDGNVVSDTLNVYAPETISASAGQLNEVLNYVYRSFPAKGYGMIFSSHATGYLPEGFYNDPDSYIYTDSSAAGRSLSAARPYVEPVWMREGPMVKSLGYDYARVGGVAVSDEMDLKDFAAAIPMKLDYLLFDACLMGGIEVAYELRGKCSKVGFSQAEVLAEGFDYKSLTMHLLGDDPYPQGVCEDYFLQYDVLYGNERSATVSLIDCDRLEPLAAVCRDLFSKYREGLNSIRASRVQRYYRYDCHWFYDLYDIVAEAGAEEAELAELQAALDLCVDYKAATPEFLPYSYGFTIDVFSGFSMYLPANGHLELDKYYRTLQWNKATGLVE